LLQETTWGPRQDLVVTGKDHQDGYGVFSTHDVELGLWPALWPSYALQPWPMTLWTGSEQVAAGSLTTVLRFPLHMETSSFS
jgi:hypothetical protein